MRASGIGAAFAALHASGLAVGESFGRFNDALAAGLSFRGEGRRIRYRKTYPFAHSGDGNPNGRAALRRMKQRRRVGHFL